MIKCDKLILLSRVAYLCYFSSDIGGNGWNFKVVALTLDLYKKYDLKNKKDILTPMLVVANLAIT